MVKVTVHPSFVKRKNHDGKSITGLNISFAMGGL